MLSKNYKILLIILMVVALISLNKFGGKKIRNTFYLVSSPIQKTFWRAGEGVSDFFGTLFEIKNLKKENEEFFKRNFILLQKLTLLQDLREENKTLREALDIGLREKFTLVLTEIISKETEQDFILISGGKAEGISENMPLITKEGVLVGKVKESFTNFSKVRLISAKKSVFDIEILGEKNLLGIAKGKGNLKIEFELVPKENQIEKGDIVETTTLGGNFPKGLLVGEVEEVRKTDAAPYQEGAIKPYFTATPLRTLFVIKGLVREGEPKAKLER